MQLRRELTYDAPPAEVFAMITDPAYREKASHAMGVVSVEVMTTTPDPDGSILITVDQVQDTSGLPAIAKKIAGDTTRAVVTEAWTSPTTASTQITAPGKPTKATGTITLTGETGGTTTTYTLDLDVVVKVPLIGGKLEKLMADNIEAGLQVEHTVGQAWLKGDR